VNVSSRFMMISSWFMSFPLYPFSCRVGSFPGRAAAGLDATARQVPSPPTCKIRETDLETSFRHTRRESAAFTFSGPSETPCLPNHAGTNGRQWSWAASETCVLSPHCPGITRQHRLPLSADRPPIPGGSPPEISPEARGTCLQSCA